MSQPQSPDERRHFTRVPFDATVYISQHGNSWQAQLLDISLQGVLVSLPEHWVEHKDPLFDIELRLDADIVIAVSGKIAHAKSDHIGFLFDHMELDSASHLKRLLLLNLGDQSLLDSEIHELISVHSTAAPAPQTGA